MTTLPDTKTISGPSVVIESSAWLGSDLFSIFMFDYYEDTKNQKREDRRFYAWVHATGDCHADGVRNLADYDIVEYRGVSEDRQSNNLDDCLRVHDENGNPHWIAPGQLSHMTEADVIAVHLDPAALDAVIAKTWGPASSA